MRSLIAPLVVGLLLSLVVVFAVQWSLFGDLVDDALIDYIADELTQDSEELFGSLTLLPGGATALALTHFDPPFLQLQSGRYYQIQLEGAAVLRSPSLGDATLAMTRVSPTRSRREFIAGPAGQDLLLVSTGYSVKGHSVTIGVAADVKPIRAQFQRLQNRYSQITVIMFALLVALQVAIVRLSFGALRRIQGDVVRLERGEIALLGERVPREVLPLVREVNRLVTLLMQRLQRSRESLGNLAHALKTPLTVLKHMAEDERFQRDRTLASEMAQQVDLLRSRIDVELRRARVAGGRVTGAPIAAAKEIDALLDTLARIYRQRHLEIDRDIDSDCGFSGDREDFVELCGNLLDNACKWAHARILVSAHGTNALVLTVEDDGPGCSPELLDQIGQRGVRLDEATEGHGLGLAIVNGIAATYGAEVRYGRSPTLGGFSATVSFPTAWRPAAL